MDSLTYSKTKVASLLNEVKDEDELWVWLKFEAQNCLKSLIEKGLEFWAGEAIGCGRYERSDSRVNYRNGYYERELVTTLGKLGLRVPRLENGTYAKRFFERYQRRGKDFDAAVLSCFVFGSSTRDCGKVSRFFTGAGLSSQSVSNILRHLDEQAREFHFRALEDKYEVLLVDGLWVHCYEGRVFKRVILFVMGITAEGKKELIDFKVAKAESQGEWEGFFNSLYQRGLKGEKLKLMINDGQGGIEAARQLVYPQAEPQRCTFHKVANVAQNLRGRKHRWQITREAGNIYQQAQSRKEAYDLLDQFIRHWGALEPAAVRSFVKDFGVTLTYFKFPRERWQELRTTNALERVLKDFRKRINPMGCFNGSKSIERIIYALVRVKDAIFRGPARHEFPQTC